MYMDRKAVKYSVVLYRRATEFGFQGLTQNRSHCIIIITYSARKTIRNPGIIGEVQYYATYTNWDMLKLTLTIAIQKNSHPGYAVLPHREHLRHHPIRCFSNLCHFLILH